MNIGLPSIPLEQEIIIPNHHRGGIDISLLPGSYSQTLI